MAQNSNISISSVAARFINAPIDRKKRAVSSREPILSVQTENCF